MQISRYMNLAAVRASTVVATSDLHATWKVDVDTANCEGALFIGLSSMTTAVKTWNMKLSHGPTSTGFVACSSNHFLESTGTRQPPLAIDVHKPVKRWLRCEFSCSDTSNAASQILGFTYGTRKPVSTWTATGDGVAATPALKRVVSPTST
jgi:hypothetical protein